jgi:hypothetical protein
MFDLPLAFQRGGFVCTGYTVNQINRPSATRVLGAFSGIMNGEPFVEVIRNTTIQRVVCATQQIANPAHSAVDPSLAGTQMIS